LTIGTLLGLYAGFAPGPLLTLVISETLQHGIKSGIKVALAPIVTDLPIIVLTLFIFSMGYKSLRIRGVEIDFKEAKPKSLTKGVLANALSPHPYLFWFSVGAPTVTKAMAQNISAAVAFIVSFYAFLVGSKICLAIFTGKSKSLLSGKMYIFIMRLLGLALCILAIILIRDGLELLQIIKA